MVEPKLGQKVKDRATGLIGIVYGKTQRMGIGVQYDVQPEGDGKTVPSGFFIDPFQMEIVDNGIMDALPTERQAITVEMGSKGRDKVSGKKGIVTAITESMNGCVHVSLVNKKGDTHTIPQSRFELTSNKIMEETPVRTGGRPTPSERL